MGEDKLANKLRIPVPAGGIQVNFCKNPGCPNFGVPASEDRQPTGSGAASRRSDRYIVTGSVKSGLDLLKCKLCGEYPTIKSNLAISEEVLRLSDYLSPSATLISCPNNACPSRVVDIKSDKKAYYSFGKTKGGSQRYRCRLCKTTFAVSRATTGQKKPHKNLMVFRLLMNKMPFQRICETAGLGSMNALYWKIDFIHRQCLAFAADRERKLLEGMPIKRLYIAVDRQDYMVNWSKSTDKRNVILHSVGSSDNETGYVFGLHLNFDPAMDSAQIEKEALECGDYDIKKHFRRYARLWLAEDYEDAVAKGTNGWRGEQHGSLLGNIKLTYDQALEREDVEVSEEQYDDTKLPARGMQVHAEYTLYGHFFFLKQLLSGVDKVRFFLDQDSGMRAACLGAFASRIKEGTCDAFYVRINKGLTINQKRQLMALVRKEWDEVKKLNPDLSDSKLKLMIIKERMKEVMSLGKWNDKWLRHPFPNMSEPEKALCYLTDIHGYDEDHKAWLYNKASLHSCDRFFMQIRRRLSLLERPIATSSSTGRKWHGYSAYNPAVIIKMLDIFRVFYNYIEIGKDKQTPALRLGLAKGRVSIEDILLY
ncbi:MAG: transposase [Dissulfurispiraceae bacterium]